MRKAILRQLHADLMAERREQKQPKKKPVKKKSKGHQEGLDENNRLLPGYRYERGGKVVKAG